MPGKAPVGVPDLAGWLRAGLAMLCVVAAIGESFVVQALPWALGVVLLELLATGRDSRGRLAVLVTETGVVFAAVVFTFPDHRSLLPLLLVPAFRAGELHGVRAGLLTSGVLALAPLTAWLKAPNPEDVSVGLQWSALALAIAVLGAWGSGFERDRHSGAAAARKAGELLGRLQDLAKELPAGFDVPAVSEMLVDEVLRAAPAHRAAVLVRIGPDEMSPVVVRGVDRVPWRDPVTAPGTAHRAWIGARTVKDVRRADVEGRRRGSAMLVVPVADRDDEVLGLLVLERLAPRQFSIEEVASVERAVAVAAPRLHAALAFVELRIMSEVAERERLAREMHDGVAQDLVAVGFGLDMVQRQLRARDPEMASQVQEVRGQLNRTLRDIRYSIAALRTSVRPERGLGAALSSAAQTLGPATGASVSFSLKESPFRLPAHVESALLRLAQDFFADVRSAGTVSRVHVVLETDAPTARLELGHDGPHAWAPDPAFATALADLGGSVAHRQVDGVWTSTLSVGTTFGERPSTADGAAESTGTNLVTEVSP